MKYTGSIARIIIEGKEYQTFVVRSQNYVKSGFTVISLTTDYLTNRLSDMESPLSMLFRRLGSMISSEHQKMITEAISWRYAKLLEMGYIQ